MNQKFRYFYEDETKPVIEQQLNEFVEQGNVIMNFKNYKSGLLVQYLRVEEIKQNG